VKWIAVIFLVFLFCVGGVVATANTTIYYLANSSIWVCPAGYSTVNVMMMAGGNGGFAVVGGVNASGGTSSPPYYYSGIPVTPGRAYAITVGPGGDGHNYVGSYTSHGEDTSAFGFNVSSNTSLSRPAGVYNGQVGYGGLVQANPLAPPAGCGIGGIGNGAGGGGGCNAAAPTFGGIGAPGMVLITNGSFPDANYPIPSFYAPETTINPGASAQFVDTSIVTNTTDLSYSWNFGDGSGNLTTIGSVSHIYAYQGVYTVSLTIHAAGVDVSTVKIDYINVVAGAQQIQYTTPHDVKINVRSLSGPIQGVHINCTFVQTSGPWSWITKWIGGLTGSGESSVQNTTLSADTDSNGAADFLLVSAVQYNITAYLPGVIDQTMFIYPTDNDYTFWSMGAINASVAFESGCNKELIFASANGSENAAETIGNITVFYQDPLNGTSSVRIFINQSHHYGNFTNETSLANTTVAGVQSFTRYFEVSSPPDQSYIVHINATTGSCGYVVRDYGVTFPPAPISLGIPYELLMYAGMAIMIFLSLGFTKGYVGETLAAMTLWGWAAFLMRWWNELAPWPAVVGVLTLMTLMAVFYNVAIRSKKVYWG
jgi:PKD repeat protein